MATKESDIRRDQEEWTIMFYFAADNPLAPAVVSQLKALKNAGYHQGANVLAYYDPEMPDTPPHIFDVNRTEKIEGKKPRIGFDRDPFVKNLMFDKLWKDEISRDHKTTIRDLFINELREKVSRTLGKKVPNKELPPIPPVIDEVKVDGEVIEAEGAAAASGTHKLSIPEQSLDTFLQFCAREYPARHYMLFLLGHGLIVGNDVFLFDEHAKKHSVSLGELGRILQRFRNAENVKDGEFDLISFHSCSMSSVELVSELRGTAKFMIASQGTAYVGSWPYLSILLRILNDLDRELKRPIKEVVEDIFFYVRHNSTDFLLAGYSFDLCLCELGGKLISGLETAVSDLAEQMSKGLQAGAPAAIKHAILLAHWQSQSFWQESYTDLYDFCFCLDRYLGEMGVTDIDQLKGALDRVMDALVAERRVGQEDSERLITKAQFVGPGSQYAHGLSIYFPWAEPSHDRPVLGEYREYAFQQRTNWLGFLKTYFDQTMRESRRGEKDARIPIREQTPHEALFEDMTAIMFGSRSGTRGAGALDDDPPPVKTRPTDPMGQIGPRDPMGDSEGSRVKNFPHDTRPHAERATEANFLDHNPIFFNL